VSAATSCADAVEKSCPQPLWKYSMAVDMVAAGADAQKDAPHKPAEKRGAVPTVGRKTIFIGALQTLIRHATDVAP
jgi:hypothetical protein